MCVSSSPCALRSSARAQGRETSLVGIRGLQAKSHSPILGGGVEKKGQPCVGTGHTVRRKKCPPPNNSKKGFARAVVG